MRLKKRTLSALAEMVCGSSGRDDGFSREGFPYRSSKYLTEFFMHCDLEHVHGGSTRKDWVLGVLSELNKAPPPAPELPPQPLIRVIQELMDASNFDNEYSDRVKALAGLNNALAREGIQATLDELGRCELRVEGSVVATADSGEPRRAWTEEELAHRKYLEEFLATVSEDELTEELVVPLFRQMGFQRVTVAGHRDKALELGKDLWMKLRLPTTHYLYFGVQVKREKIDASGRSSANVAEILNQITMALGHPIWDPETNRRNLLDHVYVLSAGTITKQAKQWLGERLDADKRRSIMFIDRADLLNLATALSVCQPPPPQERAAFSIDDVLF